ncbi:MAG: radical SAM protein [Sedimentisphaerales bacterium]
MNYKAYQEISERIKLANAALANCKLCPRECGVNRIAGEKGFCGLDNTVRYFREVLYCGEEEQLNPSHQIHLAGCNLKCEFCVVSEWNQQPFMAKELNYANMAKIITQKQEKGAKNLNILGGEPAVNLHGVLELVKNITPEIILVWNSNMYYNDIVDRLMAGLIDICLADFKVGNNDCARKLLGVCKYIEVVEENIVKAAKHSDVIIRHLVVPGHSKCCLKPIFNWIAQKLPNVKLSLRSTYVPPVQRTSSPAGYLTQEEMQNAVKLAEIMGLNLVK